MFISSNQFSRSLDQVISESLDISDEHHQLAVERYKSIGNWLERRGSTVAYYRPEIYPQGSFLLGTVTRPVSNAEEYDIDLVSELDLKKIRISQEELKNLVGDEIKAYARTHYLDLPKNGRRCWTLNYPGNARFHMDILPAIPDEESFKQTLLSNAGSFPNFSIAIGLSSFAIAITDRDHCNYNRIDRNWPRSNPKGYAAWFMNRGLNRDLTDTRAVEEVPDHSVKTPLQRTVQILKRHRDIWFDKMVRQHHYTLEDKPISIIITTLAAHAYEGEKDLQEALQHIVRKLPNYIECGYDGVAYVRNPVDPLENFADKWQEHPSRKDCFMAWLEQVSGKMNDYLARRDISAMKTLLRLR